MYYFDGEKYYINYLKNKCFHYFEAEKRTLIWKVKNCINLKVETIILKEENYLEPTSDI